MGYKSKNDVQGGTDVNVGKNGVRGTVVYKSKSGVQWCIVGTELKAGLQWGTEVNWNTMGCKNAIGVQWGTKVIGVIGVNRVMG